MPNETFDIAIIGAGPAGCACALALHESGLRVVMLDKDIFPRDKICGDAIPGLAFKAMSKINPKWEFVMRQLIDKEDIRTAKIYAPNNKIITLDWVTYAYNSKRLNFDNFLFQLVKKETSTTIFENKRLQKVVVGNGGVHCQFQDNLLIHATIVIGCDGANSMVMRQLGSIELQNAPSCAAVRAYYHGIEELKEGVNEFHFFKDLMPGYFWIFPLENGWANVGFGILNTKASKNKNKLKLRDTLDIITKTLPSIAPRFKNAQLMDSTKGFALPLGTQKLPISGHRFMLCGDAASLINPLQGHGIDNAMWCGLFAAQQATECFKKNNFEASFMAQYDEAVYKKIGTELAINAFIMRLFSRFPFLFNAFGWVGQNQKLMQWIARVLRI